MQDIDCGKPKEAGLVDLSFKAKTVAFGLKDLVVNTLSSSPTEAGNKAVEGILNNPMDVVAKNLGETIATCQFIQKFFMENVKDKL